MYPPADWGTGQRFVMERGTTHLASEKTERKTTTNGTVAPSAAGASFGSKPIKGYEHDYKVFIDNKLSPHPTKAIFQVVLPHALSLTSSIVKHRIPSRPPSHSTPSGAPRLQPHHSQSAPMQEKQRSPQTLPCPFP